MSIICQTFVQNAWRSDLCSNCFKSLADHTDSGGRNTCERLSTPRYVPQATSLYQSRGISSSLKWRLGESLYDRVSRRDFGSQTPPKVNQLEPENNSKGILIKSSDKKLRSRPSVDFAAEEALVIGYGGNDYDSDHSPWEMGSDDGSIDLDQLDDTDEDRKITKLTKNNTEFNSFNKNLLSGEVPPLSSIKKEEEKLNSINNNVNNSMKATDKALNILSCVTYNDIQTKKTEKKLNQYYFPSNTEALKSYLHKNSNMRMVEDSLHKNNNELLNSSKIENHKIELPKNENTNSRIVLSDDFTPLNTRTYSFVSELNKNNMSFEQSSDSDYSTYRHTAGDSTDSESFHDAEEQRALPCSSFLHGNFSTSPSLDNDKKYDAGSSTSGDVSNFSDDSDAHESTAERSTYKSRIVRSNKASQASDKHSTKNSVHVKDAHTKSDKKPATEIKTSPTTSNTNSKHAQTSALMTSRNNSGSAVPHSENNHKLKGEISDASNKNKEPSKSKDNLNAHGDRKNETSAEKVKSSPKHAPDIPQNIDVNIRSIIKVNGSPVSSDKRPDTNQSSAMEDQIQPSRVTKEATETIHNKIYYSTPMRDKNDVQIETSGNSTQLVEAIPFVDYTESDIRDQRDYEESSDYERSPDAIVDRQSKLAALALELELARRDSASKAGKVNALPTQQLIPPEIKMRFNPPSVTPAVSSPAEHYPTIKKSSAISCANRLSSLPDVLQETPTKQKKNKFSLKKLLKRNKDSGTFTPASKEVNPKAWKKQTFDRSRLSLEIVHPMDLTSDPATSADSTPTEDYRVSTNPGKAFFKGVSSRARSLSALPQLASDFQDQSGCALLECRKMDTVPMRKAGTVAERKKNRPALVRTPSCSALPNRPATSSTAQNSERTPPPKPPPPPKCKVTHPPPPPPPQTRPHKPPSCSPARPPPPKIPDIKSRGQSNGSSKQEPPEQTKLDKEYANLGDIRSLLTPKKPQRPSAFSAHRDNEMESRKNSDGIYETLQVAEEEEDHYTYLDEAELKTSKKTEAVSKESLSKFKPKGEFMSCGRPWLDLQTSYAAIAAANYESLAELITTSLNEGVEYFQKAGQSLKWKDFDLETEEPVQTVRNRAIYNGICKNQVQDKITLMVASKKQTVPQNARNNTRYPVLASFYDYVPKHTINIDYTTPQEKETASIYVLEQSQITTVSQFAQDSSSDNNNQHIHLRNYCFLLLQLIHTLKSLQAEGIEEINYDLQVLILAITNEEKPPILVLFPDDKIYLTLSDSSHNRKTLCQVVLETMFHLLQIKSTNDLESCSVNGENLAEPVAHTFRAIAKVLSEEKASSLSQAKGLLEYMLWGPVDVKITHDDEEGIVDTILQRWLDLQRAQMIKSTISCLQIKKNLHIGLHVYEEYQLIFLLQASVKSLKNVISKL